MLEIGPPAVFSPNEEIGIDAFHHVYAVATGGVYALLEGSGR